MSADMPRLQDLLAQTASGDHAAFEELYRRTNAHLFGVAVRILQREQAAEDALQEAFVSVWKSAAQYRSSVGGQEIQPMTWLIAIVRNKALDALRARTRLRETELAEPDDDSGAPRAAASQAAQPSALDLFSEATRALRVEGCLGALDGTHRQSLALAYFQGLTHREVAAQMGAPLGSVKAWVRRGLEKLKACLAEAGVP